MSKSSEIEFATPEIVQQVLDESPKGKNTDFLLKAHNLWIRFEYYKSSLPLVLKKNDKIVALVFATYPSMLLNRLLKILVANFHQ